MKILALTAENVMKLKAVRIEPDGSMIVIGGRNAQGKSAVLKAIEIGLRVGWAIPDKPIRTGAKKSNIRLDLGTDDAAVQLVAKVAITNKGATLTVTDAQGKPVSSPQAALNALFDKRSFDPVAFISMSSEKQVDELKKLAGLDFSSLDATRQKAYDARRDINRDLKAVEVQIPEPPPAMEGVPDDEVDSGELLSELDRRRQQNTKIQEDERALLEMDGLLDRTKEALRELATRQDALIKQVEKLTKAVEANVPADETEISDQIRSADETNAKARAKRAYAALLRRKSLPHKRKRKQRPSKR